MVKFHGLCPLMIASVILETRNIKGLYCSQHYHFGGLFTWLILKDGSKVRFTYESTNSKKIA